MRIGMLTACYDPVVNGVTRMVAQYDRHLTAAGHQVTIFTLGKAAEGEDTSKVVRSPAIPLGDTGYYYAPRYTREAQSKLRGVDVIHCHHVLMGLEFARRYGQSPVVFTNHTRYDLYLSVYTRLPSTMAKHTMRVAWRRLSGFADVVIAPSVSTQALLHDAGVRTPIELIENGIDVRRFQRPKAACSRAEIGIPAAAIVFTYVGRLTREKNLQRLASEFCQAAASLKKIHLMLVGEGPLQATLERQVASAGLSDRLHFIGQVTPDQVPMYLAISDAFASASLSEVHPLTVIEAIAAGLPVVAIDAPGISDVVENGRSGLLVSNSPGSLAGAISSLAKSGVYRHRLGAGAALAGASYDFRNTAEKTLALYRRLLRGHAPLETDGAECSGVLTGLKGITGGHYLRGGASDPFRGQRNDGR